MAKSVFVVHAYKTNCSTVDQPPGLGDFIFGTASLYRYSQMYGFQLRIDLSDHPLRHVLSMSDDTFLRDYECLPCIGHYEFFNERRHHVANFIETVVLPYDGNDGAYVVLTTHEYPPDPIPQDAKRLIQRFFTPCLSVYHKFQNILQSFGFEAHEYAVVHIRSGDCFGQEDPLHVQRFVDHVVSHKHVMNAFPAQKILVMSDSYQIKKQVSAKLGYHFLDVVPCHFGSQKCFANGTEHASIHDKNNIENVITDSFLELFLNIHASHLFSHSIYGAPSGFAHIPRVFYNVPLTSF